MNPELIEQLVKQLGLDLGANGLPYRFPLHPNLVHFTLGIFIISLIFDFAGALFPLDQPVLKIFQIPVRRANFFDVAWYNAIAGCIITFFTVTAGIFEILLAQPPVDMKSDWGLEAGTTMLLHGVGGILLFTMMVGMTIWRGWQRFRLRKNHPRQVQWGYLAAALFLMGYMFVHGTLGAQLGAEFGVHNTAAKLIRMGENPNHILGAR
ncbi:DUF2231 domain-containing protein [Chroococcus sp. FPU101]|uniref:DUF2231 domain-containing protein n=1 Tax=Chroococcus sp. FPU101 TaxID=1974212 RepID=UPI001A8C910E|nr:DUF2231 domain-containing protein [Chroococcus sp. FPU101]GFE71416.1 hypothetical protein CFPU101_40260 [Chroococcus sp. FPU101]